MAGIDGGDPEVDVRWPDSLDDVLALSNFAEFVVTSLQEHGYCRVGLPDTPEGSVQAASRLSSAFASSFGPPSHAFAEALLGADLRSDTVDLQVEDLDDPLLSIYMEQLNYVSDVISPWVVDAFGFAPARPCSRAMLRRAKADANTDDAGALAKPDDGVSSVEEFLKFSTRRRICLLYFIDVYGTVLLKAKNHGPKESRKQDVSLSVAPGSVLLFRHEAFIQSYAPRPSELILQAWILEQEPELQLQSISGGREEAVNEALNSVIGFEGMPKVPHPMQVTGTALHGAGSCYDADNLWLALCSCIDTHINAPITRWRWEEYPEPEHSDGWGIARHAGFADDNVLLQCDPGFFGYESDEAPAWHPHQRMTLEVGYKCMFDAGFRRETLKGERINVYLADCGPDDDFARFGNPGDWKTWSGTDRMCTAGRLSYTFGLVGEATVIDTACSSANVAMNSCHQALVYHKGGFSAEKVPRFGLIVGVQAYTNGGSFVGLSQAHMLSSKGRSRSFDKSASGYARGEGSPGLFCRLADQKAPDEEDGVKVTVLSTGANQDGRSASLTAPNGPSQTACIQYVMNQANLGVDSVLKFECHGTGTALGDPIEVGSCRTVMRGRKLPLVQCSGKSNHGHFEQGAGAMGFLKTIMETLHISSGANCHLHTLNPNMDISGYPILHPVEACPLDGGGDGITTGVSSFGFGGTNSHANFFGVSHRGNFDRPLLRSALPAPKKFEKLDYITVQCPQCKGRMCWLCGVSVPKYAPQEKHICSSVRAELGNQEVCSRCYTGRYRVTGASYLEEPDPGLPIFIRGSWSRFEVLDEMRWVPSLMSGHYEHSITLGPTRREQFQLVVNRDMGQVLYPIETDAAQEIYIDGPDGDGDGKVWLIDGVLDNAPVGARYNLRFTWSRKKRTLEWKMAKVPPARP
mmetsp:Transcript_68347/g.163986  ORF Transcript_68347/g.163986 Transcript_68347/m.163986 type:complete len:917 (-) Transcript_68347:80-2830(-)